jgi:hypothetical protein
MFNPVYPPPFHGFNLSSQLGEGSREWNFGLSHADGSGGVGRDVGSVVYPYLAFNICSIRAVKQFRTTGKLKADCRIFILLERVSY